ncbi:MAG: sulfotransferase [Planctomycetota bacterium]
MVSRLLLHCADGLHAVSTPGLSDQQREKKLRPAAFGMLAESLLLALVLVGVGVFYAASSMTSATLFDYDLYSFAATLFILLGSIAFVVIIRLLNRSSALTDEDTANYSEIDQALHAVALDNPLVPRTLLWFQCLGRRTPSSLEHPVWVAGLARSGTTLISELLYESEQFRCLTYRDMPFPLSPGLWMGMNRFGSRSADVRERAHRDGMFVSLDSPEALEEVFWRVHCPEYIGRDRLSRHEPSDSHWNRFRDYIDAVLTADRQRPRRYLAKNNNLAVRFDGLLGAIPEATVVVPFRDPIRQAGSLLRQHRHWCKRHGEDVFSKRYMTWLVHHEFGSDHRPYDLRLPAKTMDPAPPYSPPDSVLWFELTHWVEQWIEVYRYLFENGNDRVLFVNYESLCSDPSPTLQSLFTKLDIDLPESTLQGHEARIKKFKPRESDTAVEISTGIREEAIDLYEQMTRSLATSTAAPRS